MTQKDPKNQQNEQQNQKNKEALGEDLETLVEEGNTIAKDIEKLQEQLTKSQADYQNLVRRSENERAETHLYITKKIMSEILPVIDTLERAIGAMPNSIKEEDWSAGIRALHGDFLRRLESMNIRPFESVGQEVDENKHDVLSQAPGKEGVVAQEFETGYTIGDKILRHAKVIVGNGQDA